MNVLQLNPESQQPADNQLKTRFWAVGGGKGGVGKSIVSLNLAYWLAKLGHQVILVDADLGGANLHTLLGIKFVNHTLADYLNRKVDSLDKITIDTPVNGLQLICGASDIVGLANPKYTQKMKLMRALQDLQADHLILDLGAGTDYNTLDFFLYCHHKIAVLTPQPTALQNGYGFIKSAIYRAISKAFGRNTRLGPLLKRATDQNSSEPIASMEELAAAFAAVAPEYGEKLQEILAGFHLYLITNMVKTGRDRKAAEIIQTVIKKYLQLPNITLLGNIPYDQQIEECVARMTPAFLTNAKSQSAMEFYSLVNTVIREGHNEITAAAENQTTIPAATT
ncbi:MAG: P-loop NTPase [Deltaproteobacteria bacterium]|jgi:flagellar biosynthesis protein FlhG|nr:P-loop NTPase [Deltaproteobacteria bacterium]